MSREKHVVICGAGVIGLCSAYYLIQRGHRVTILDRGAADHDCCSLGNAGLIPPSHFVPLSAPGMVARGLKWMLNPTSPFYLRPRLDVALARWAWRFMRAANVAHVARSAPLLRDLHLASRKLFEELAARAGNDFGLVQRGLLMLCKTEQAIEEEAKFAAHAQALGVPVEIVSARRAAELDPGVKMDIAGAIYFPLDCHLTPSRFLASLTRTLEQCGAKFLWSHNVTGWRDARARVHAALTDKGEIAADEFVLAGGAWSAGVVRGLALSLPLQPAKGYSLTLPQPPRLPQLSSILVERWVAITPMGNALRVGGTLELSGFNQEIRRERVRQIVSSVPKYFPEFREEDFRDVPVWHGFRPCSPDGMPYVGRFGRYENLCAATGHAMNGLSLGPITGQLVAEIISGEKPSIDIAQLSPDRYA